MALWAFAVSVSICRMAASRCRFASNASWFACDVITAASSFDTGIPAFINSCRCFSRAAFSRAISIRRFSYSCRTWAFRFSSPSAIKAMRASFMRRMASRRCSANRFSGVDVEPDAPLPASSSPKRALNTESSSKIDSSSDSFCLMEALSLSMPSIQRLVLRSKRRSISRSPTPGSKARFKPIHNDSQNVMRFEPCFSIPERAA